MELLDSLNIDPKAILVNIVGFLALWFVLRKMVFTPIGKLLQERQHDITTTYDKLEADRRQMDALRSEYEHRLAAIEAEAREKIQNAIKDAQASREQILHETNERSREMIARAEQEIQHEREQALITLRQQVVELAMNATSRVIGDSMDESRQRRLIDEFITSSASGGAMQA